MPPYPLTKFDIQKYYENKPKFDCVYSRSNLPKIRDRVYVINLGKCKSIGTHWIVMYENGENVTYFENLKIWGKKTQSFLTLDETRNYFLEEIKHNDLASKNHKNILNCIEHLLMLASSFTGYVPISAFSSVVVIPVGVTNSAFGLNICVITAGIKKYIYVNN